MSKKTYKLRIPIPGEGESLPEFVSHGNLEATLVPGKLVETSDANFARHLELSYGLTPQEKADVETGSEASDDSDGKEFDDAQADETAAKKTNKRRN